MTPVDVRFINSGMESGDTFSLGGRAVLIAEDEMMIAMLAEDVIEELGGRVVGVAATCDAALAMLANGDPALVLLDVNLDGGTSERVVGAAAARGIPVLVSSGSDANALPPEFRGLPMLGKPWGFGEMRQALAALLPSAHDAGQPPLQASQQSA